MKLKEGFILCDICGEKVVIASGKANINFNRLFRLTESAAWLWQEADRQGEFTVASLADALCQEYDISPSNAFTDVSELTEQWIQEGVVEM